jgi:F-box protein 21
MFSGRVVPLPCAVSLTSPTLCSVQEDKSTRYVAEENVELLAPKEIVPDAFPIEIGKWFKRWDDKEKVFVSNIHEEYPDD